MGDRLKELKERSQKRKQLLAQAFGVGSPDGLKAALKSKDNEGAKLVSVTSVENDEKRNKSKDVLEAKGQDNIEKEKAGDGEDEEELDEIYKDSSTFLKGTQSANPHNDYCQNFVDTGERPQNKIRDVGLANRFEEYPKLRELIRLKDELIAQTNSPPMYLQCELETFDLRSLGCQFDVILVEPPLEEYSRSTGAVFNKYWNWDEIEHLDIPSVAAQRSFIWIWCGNSDGLDRGRQCLKRWGYRRCEDICWIKTNIDNPGRSKALEPNAIFQRTKEHCLMGIRGTVKRSTDGDFIHANVDIDLIIADEPQWGSKEKPVEIFHIIEHFCLGRRRLHLFGRDDTIRNGWLTLGPELTCSNFNVDIYTNFFTTDGHVMICTDEIERLRPKSPTPKNKQGTSDRGRGGGQRGRGGGRGGISQDDQGGRSGGQMSRGGNMNRPGMSRGSNFGARGRSRGFKMRGSQQR